MHEPHLDRARAGSFGSVAAQYDSYRPTYSEALIDDLAALRPAQVLDVGCGTGKAATALVSRGLSVLGVEPDEQMVGVARGHGIPIEVAAFETWDEAGRQFDLLTCGAAWHWIDPALGTAKAARVVRRGGTVARFWNYEVPDEPAASALESVYGRLAPEATRFVHFPPSDWPDPLAESDAFSAAESRTYEWSRSLGADEWIGMVTTFSDHQRLRPERLAELQQELRTAIETLGGTVHARGGTYVRLVRRQEDG
jgi:SAM-dependent methyltransferase